MSIGYLPWNKPEAAVDRICMRDDRVELTYRPPGKTKPMTGGIRFWARPGTIRLRPWRRASTSCARTTRSRAAGSPRWTPTSVPGVSRRGVAASIGRWA
jgi:hypothetical protein